jgi:hypothetical protein
MIFIRVVYNPGAAGATGSFSIQNTITFDHAGRRTNFITTISEVLSNR